MRHRPLVVVKPHPIAQIDIAAAERAPAEVLGLGHGRSPYRAEPSVFGIDNVDITLTGKSTATMTSCTGTAKQAPDLTFEAIRIKEMIATSSVF